MIDEYKNIGKIVRVHDEVQGDWIGKIKRTVEGSDSLYHEVVPCGYNSPIRVHESVVEII